MRVSNFAIVIYYSFGTRSEEMRFVNILSFFKKHCIRTEMDLNLCILLQKQNNYGKNAYAALKSNNQEKIPYRGLRRVKRASDDSPQPAKYSIK